MTKFKKFTFNLTKNWKMIEIIKINKNKNKYSLFENRKNNLLQRHFFSGVLEARAGVDSVLLGLEEL